MNEVLKRKLTAAAAPKKAAAVSMESLMRKTMPRDADAVLSLELAVTSFAVSSLQNAELREGIGPSELIYLLKDATGARGLAVLDPCLAATIIEVQLAGRISETPPPERPPTRTDGIVAGEIVDRWLGSANAAATEAGIEATCPFAGFAREPVGISRREAELLLEPVEFRTIDITLALGGGGREGRLRLAAPRPLALVEQQRTTTAARVRSHLPDLPVQFNIILARLPMSVARIRELAVDDNLTLPKGCLTRVRLETADGHMIQQGRLGQLDGRKAVRLSDEMLLPSPEGALAGLMAPPNVDIPSLPDPAADEGQPTEAALPQKDAQTGAGASEPVMPDLPDLPDLPELP